MDDAEYEAQKARVQRLIAKWVRPIGLGWWQINMEWTRAHGERRDDDFEVKFVCRADWRYALANITVYLPGIAGVTDDDLERMFVHELMHVFLCEMRVTDEDGARKQRDHEERVATMLANGFMWMHDALVCDRPHIGDGAVITGD